MHGDLLFTHFKVKFAKTADPTGQSPAPAVDTPQPSSTPSPAEEMEDDHTIKGRTKSLTEHMVQVHQTNILERVLFTRI